MEIPQRGQQVAPPFVPTYKQPVSTLRAEKHLAKAREYRYQAHMFSSVLNIAQMGAQVGEKILEAIEVTDLMKAETIVSKRQQEFLLSLTDPYTEEMGARPPGPAPKKPIPYEEWEKRTADENLKIKNDVLAEMRLPRSKKTFEERYEKIANDFTYTVAVELRRQEILEAEGIYYASKEAAIENNNIAKVKEYIIGAKAALILSPEDAVKDLQDAEERIAYNIAKRAAYSLGDFEKALQFIHTPEMNKVLKENGINPARFTDQAKESLEQQLRVDRSLQLSIEDREHRKRRVEQNLTIADRYAKNDPGLVDWLIEETKPGGELSDIEDTEYRAWINMIESRPDTVEKGKWEITDPDVEAEVIKYVNDPEKTKQEKIDFIKSKHGEGLSNDDTNRYLNKLGVPGGRWDITDADIEAKVIKYINNPDKTLDEKIAYVKGKHGFGLSNDDTNKYLAKLGQPAGPKAGKSPYEESNPEMLAEVLRMIFDDDYNLPMTEDYIMDNMGPDPETGEPRIAPKDVKSLMPFARTHEKSPAYVRAMKEIDQAFKDGIIDNSQYTAILNEFTREVNQGDKTEEGIVDQMKNLLIQSSEEYAEDVLEEAEDYRWYGRRKKREAEVERYLAEHEPETRYEGTPKHFADWMAISVEETQSQYYAENMMWAHLYKNRIYTFMRGAWHVLNQEGTAWNPYRRSR